MTLPAARPTGLIATLLLALLLSSCGGYRLGNVPRADMEGVQTIYVPVVLNETYEPGLQVMTTNAIISRLERDGTYKSSRVAKADATLQVTITDFTRQTLRSSRDDFRVTQQYRYNLTAKFTLTNHRTGTIIFNERTILGETDFFIQDDPQEGERQALPLTADKLADRIVSLISEGW